MPSCVHEPDLAKTVMHFCSKSPNHAHSFPNNQGMCKNNRKQQLEPKRRVHVQQRVRYTKHQNTANTCSSKCQIQNVFRMIGGPQVIGKYSSVQHEMGGGM